MSLRGEGGGEGREALSFEELLGARRGLAKELERRRAELEQRRGIEGEAFERVERARRAYEKAGAEQLEHERRTRDEVEQRRVHRTERVIPAIGALVKLRRELGAHHPQVEESRAALERLETALGEEERSARRQAEERHATLAERRSGLRGELDAARAPDGHDHDSLAQVTLEVDLAQADLLRHDRLLHEAVREVRALRVAELAERRQELESVRRRHGGESPLFQEAVANHRTAVDAVRAIRAAETTARTEIHDGRQALLPEDPAEEVARLAADRPIALFPVRLETRWVRSADGNGGELRVRIYPDSLAADSHEPVLTANETAAGEDFWRKARADGDEREAWTALLTEVEATRAAWIVSRTQPLAGAGAGAGAGADGDGELRFPAAVRRPDQWSRSPQARVLPDRWLVLAYRDRIERQRVLSRPVQEPLTLASGLGDDGEEPGLDDAGELPGSGLRLDPQVHWSVDFEGAERVGMAVRLPLQQEDFELGFQRLLVLGVKSSLPPEAAARELETLLDGHRHTRGFAFVRQGTATNNSEGGTAGYPPPDPGGAESFAVARGGSLALPGRDGRRFASALGLHPRAVNHVVGADRDEQRPAEAMAEALWPATIGYFLEQMMAPNLSEDAVEEARRHFVGYVRGRGPLPAFRVGSVPYALLPVSSLYDWQPDAGAQGAEQHLPALLLRLRNIWSRHVGSVPRVGRTADADADLLSALALAASTCEVRVRSVLGFDAQWNLLELAGIDLENGVETQRSMARQLLDALGHPDWDPRVLYMSYSEDPHPFRYGLVTSAELTQEQPLELLSESRPLDFDYVNWIRTAGVAELRRPGFPARVEQPRALLYLMLRHAALTVYGRAARSVLLERGQMQREELREAELVGITGPSLERPTIWQRLERPVAGLTGGASLGEFLSQPRAQPAIPQDIELNRYRAALRALEGLPTAELERLFTETLDVCSHRVDAWITSLVTRRLETMRAVRPLASHLGAYGWVDDLRPDQVRATRPVQLPDGRRLDARTDSDGYIYAPSMAHATTAAILRNAYRSRASAGRSPYAVDLSSARARTALWLLDSVRDGQPLGAVLGYRFERGLHERSEGTPGLELDKFIDPFRHLYPLADGAAMGFAPVEPGSRESVTARNTVDGLALREAWRSGVLPWNDASLQPSPPERAALENELRALDDALDAVSDLLMAESVHQVVRGSHEGAGASLDTLARGVRPPEPEVVRVPRGGRSLFHRVGLVFGGDAVPDRAWAGSPATPRSRVEPYLNGWVGRVLGDPAQVRCRVLLRGHPDPVDVSLADLSLQPLDVLALARSVATRPLDAELDHRVVHAAATAAGPRGENPAGLGDAPFLVRYEPPPGDRERTFPELLEVARAINEVLGRSRPLRPADLLPPERAQEAGTADLRARELAARATTAEAEVGTAIGELEQALAALAIAGPDRRGLVRLRAALRATSLFGPAGSFPISGLDPAAAQVAELSEQAQSVLRELQGRRSRAREQPDSAAAIQAVFGREFLVVPRFTPAQPELLGRALQIGPALGDDADAATSTWFAQAARVREPLERWRRLALYAGTQGTRLTSFRVAQLPHEDGARWAALPFAGPAPEPPPAGRVSLVLHRAATPGAADPWAGLLLDEWVELIPNADELAGVTFQFDKPASQAPQGVLLAVPPVATERWSLDLLIRTLHQTLELSQIRGLAAENLGLYGQLIPMTFLAANPDDDTIATNLADHLVGEPTIRS